MKNYQFSFLFAFMFLFIGYSGFSQERATEDILIHKTSVRSFDFRSKNLVGTTYINNDFLPAKMQEDDKIYSLRFNAYFDEMEVLKNNEEFSLQKRFNRPITFLGSNKIYQVFEYNHQGKETKGYFVVLMKGEKINLLLQEKIKYIAEVEPKTGYDKYKPPSLIRTKDKFFIAFKNNTTKEIPRKKKDFLSLFSSKSKDVENYMKKNKLSFKNADDLVKIFNYYDSLK